MLSLGLYLASLLLIDQFFDRNFVYSQEFLAKTLGITLVSCVPLYIIKILRRRFSPPAYVKVN